jgi:hypothetical protein
MYDNEEGNWPLILEMYLLTDKPKVARVLTTPCEVK